MNRRRVLTIALLFIGPHLAAPCIVKGDIYDSLLSNGVLVAPQESIKLPPPVLADGLGTADQHRAITRLIAERYDWETFSRRSVVSPLLLKIVDNRQATGQMGRRVELYFIAYGDFGKLGSDNYLAEQLNLAGAESKSEDGNHIHVLSGEELTKRNLPTPRRAEDPRWIAIESTLLNKVRITLTTRNMMIQSADAVVIASVADPRFDSDAEYRNCWRSITTDDAGRKQMGPPQPYAAIGSYAKATQLTEPTGAVFIEYHVAFAEPEGWFHGTNLLRSKLPIVAQDMVRSFRRDLDKR
jgi:hypothetical protein